MITIEQIDQLIREHPDRRFFIHDGFNPWSYGTPLDPVLITPDTARSILDLAARREAGDVLQAVRQEYPPLQYAEAGDDLYGRTLNNRFIAFLNPETCSYSPEDRGQRGVVKHLRV